VIDKMLNYYGKAIRGNKGHSEGMKKSSRQFNMVKNDKKIIGGAASTLSTTCRHMVQVLEGQERPYKFL
jgi:hypothetical protein